MAMPDYQQRVVDEKNELSEKHRKLRDFFDTERFKNLDPAEQDRMCRQSNVMGEYLLILEERIAAF